MRSKIYHPDRQYGVQPHLKAFSAPKFASINYALTVLENEKLRDLYDKHGYDPFLSSPDILTMNPRNLRKLEQKLDDNDKPTFTGRVTFPIGFPQSVVKNVPISCLYGLRVSKTIPKRIKFKNLILLLKIV